MTLSLKKRYPFRLGTTSFIYPADYASNVRQLAPYVDEIELLLFESDHLPPAAEIDALAALALDHDLSYNAHLPTDVALASVDASERRRCVDAIAQSIDRVAPLHPTTHTLHLTFDSRDKSDDGVDRWQKLARESVEHLLKISGIPPRSISIENLDFPPHWFEPIVEALDLSVCVDVGHAIAHGFDLNQVLALFESRTTMLHLHGVKSGIDHRALHYLGTDHRKTISSYLRNYEESVSIEVFNPERLNASMGFFPELMNQDQ